MTEYVIDTIIEESDNLTESLVALEAWAFEGQNKLTALKEQYSTKYGAFLLNETELIPEGGPKNYWNDAKRTGWMENTYPELVESIRDAEISLKEIELSIRNANIRISGINRKIRLLELARVIAE